MVNTYRIALWNANGLVQRRDGIDTEKIDILLVSETHFTNKSYFSIPGYNYYSALHPDRTALAGTAILTKNN